MREVKDRLRGLCVSLPSLLSSSQFYPFSVILPRLADIFDGLEKSYDQAPPKQVHNFSPKISWYSVPGVGNSTYSAV